MKKNIILSLFHSLKQLYWDIKYGPKKIFALYKDKQLRILEIFGYKLKWVRHLSKNEKMFYNILFDSELSEYDSKHYLDYLFEKNFGHTINWENPQTFNEKLNWLKVYYHNPEITICADKYRSREFVSQRIGEGYLVKLFNVYDSPQEIDFNVLPNQFVLKTNWGSSQNIICKDKNSLDIDFVTKQLHEWLQPHSNYYFRCLEWGYKNIPPKIICEEYLKELEENPKVYKIFCFNGQPKVIQLVIDDKQPNETINYYDASWNYLDFKQGFPNNPLPQKQPEKLSQMLELAAVLSKGFPFVRTDFFEIHNKLYYSEMTFYSDAGIDPFSPPEWDLKLGQFLTLPEKNSFN